MSTGLAGCHLYLVVERNLNVNCSWRHDHALEKVCQELKQTLGWKSCQWMG